MSEAVTHQVFADPRVAELADAVAAGDRADIRRLAAGVDLSARGDKQVTLLEWAVFNQSLDGLSALLELGADPAWPGVDGGTVVHLAAMAKDPAFLEALLAHGADPDTRHSVTGATPLSAALMGERPVQFKRLLSAGADPNHADRMGNTALHVAGKINQPDHALELLKAGADANARNAQGVTFQRYAFMTPPSLLNARTRADRDALHAWLREHGIALERG
jgi:ankyrin repeat protein